VHVWPHRRYCARYMIRLHKLDLIATSTTRVALTSAQSRQAAEGRAPLTTCQPRERRPSGGVFLAEPRAPVQIGGVLWTNSIIPLFAQKRPSHKVLAPTRCRNGHDLTPDNLVPARGKGAE
jgi:hypothetical protein